MASIDGTIVAVAIPTLIRDLDTNLVWTSWVLSGYQLSQVIVAPIAGKLSDELGRKRIFLGAVILFIASSFAAGLAPNIYTLIVFRILQGLGGGFFLPSAAGLVSDAFGSRRQTAIGLTTSILPLGSIIGPNIGGALIDHISWRWIFYVNIPIGLLLLVAGAVVLPASKADGKRHHFDMAGVGLFGGAMLATLYALTEWGNNADAVSHPTIWVFFAIGLALFGLFFRHAKRAKDPVIEAQVLTSHPFLAVNLYNLLYGAVVFGLFAFVPYYASVAYGMSATHAGLILTPRSIAAVVANTVSAFALIKFGYRRPMVLGLLVLSSSIVLMSVGFHHVSVLGNPIPDLAILMAIMALAGAGTGICAPAANNATLDLLPEKVAAITGLRSMFRWMGGILGTASVALVLSRFNDKAAALEKVFLALAFIQLAGVLLVFAIPDSARERRRTHDRQPPSGNLPNGEIDGPKRRYQDRTASEDKREWGNR